MAGWMAELRRRNVVRAGVFYAGTAWLLVQIATQVFPFYDLPSWTVRALIAALAIGFPFAMLFSWFYEWTPQGITRESEIDHRESITRETGKKLDKAIIAVLSLAVLMLLLNQFVLHRFMPGPETSSAAVGDKSIAVLPLANSTGDPANEYFSDGVSEELISSLSRLSELKVIGRTSSFQFKGKTDDSKAIGEKLGVHYLLEGSVRKSSERVRIAVALVKAVDGANLWSQTYDRDFKDIFAVQSEIAGAVASQLQIALLGNNAQAAAAPGTDAPSSGNAEAYKALLQGNFHNARQTVADNRKSIDYYKAALKLDPHYALAYASLAKSQIDLVSRFPVSETGPVDALIAEARAAADTALRLQPTLARAHAVRAYILTTLDFKFAEADAEARRAVELEPQDPINLNTLAGSKQAFGEFDASIALVRRSLSLDPLNDSAYYLLSVALMMQGHYAEAETASRQGLELQPQSNFRRMQLAMVQALRGNREALVTARAVPDEFWRFYALAFSEATVGDPALADAALNQLVECCGEAGAMQIASGYAARKDADKTFAWLDRAITTRDPGIGVLYTDPFIVAFRNDPRYTAYAAKAGLPMLPPSASDR